MSLSFLSPKDPLVLELVETADTIVGTWCAIVRAEGRNLGRESERLRRGLKEDIDKFFRLIHRRPALSYRNPPRFDDSVTLLDAIIGVSLVAKKLRSSRTLIRARQAHDRALLECTVSIALRPIGPANDARPEDAHETPEESP